MALADLTLPYPHKELQLMFSRFRLQFLALLISLLIFLGVLGSRFLQTQLASPTEETPIPTITAAIATATATNAVEIQTSPTQELIFNTPLPVTNQEADRFIEGIIGPVVRLNPLLASTQAEKDIVSLIFEGLTQINQYGEAVPGLASDWVMSRDGIEYVFTLRQDVLWQDGIQFTAEDVIFTLSLLRSDDFPGSTAAREFWQTIEIEYLAANLIRFRLAQPLGNFPELLSFAILPYHALQGSSAADLATHPFNLTPVGTGAYQLQALRSFDNQTIGAVDLHAAPTYQNRPEAQRGYDIQKLRFQIFETYEQAVDAFAADRIDGLAARNTDDRQVLSTLGRVNLFTANQPAVGMLIFNWELGEGFRFFDDQRVRTALQIGLDRRNLVESNLLNRAILADSPVPMHSWAYDPTLSYPAASAARAAELLASASIQFPEGFDTGGKLFRFSILTVDDPAMIRIASEIATQWSQLNLDVQVEAVSAAELNERLESGTFQATILELDLNPEFDMYFYWHASQYPDGLNYGGVSDERVNEALERARRENNGLNRVQLYREFQRTFLSRAIAIPLYYPLYTYGVSERISGVQLGYIGSPEYRFRTIGDWVFEQ
jgi:peptide/nickel transport system substrate-binding protein